MTALSGAFLTFDALGQREDLLDKIFQISPTEVPFSSMARKNKATAVTHEWQIDALSAAAANAQLEGDVYTYSAPTATTRPANTTQISYKTMAVSFTLDAVNKAGRDREFVYQSRQRGLEVKRDMEFTFMNVQTPVPQASASSGAARALRSVASWYATNDDRGTNGADGSASAAPTDGTQRDLTEDLLKGVIKNCWNAGGQPDVIMVGPVNKQKISAMAGNATRFINADERKLIAGIAFYESDFGVHKVVPNRFQRERDCHVLDMNYWGVATLRPMKTFDTARTASAFNGVVECEYTLESFNEAASGIVADLSIT
jgi:Family of unknown function (DUF5309)